MLPWANAQKDTMIKVRNVIDVSPSAANVENPSVVVSVYYAHGGMRKRDAIGRDGAIVGSDISDCEKNMLWIVDMASRQYRVAKPARILSEQEFNTYLKEHPVDAVRIESKTVDTGERQTIFGLQARHLITTNERQDTHERETIDGWYLDRDPIGTSCYRSEGPKAPYAAVGSTLVRFPKIADLQHTGPMPFGEAVKLKITGKYADGKTVTGERTVEEFSEAPLADSLFVVPAGFKENSQLFK